MKNLDIKSEKLTEFNIKDIGTSISKHDSMFIYLTELFHEESKWIEFNQQQMKKDILIVYNLIDNEYQICHKNDPTLTKDMKELFVK